MIVLGMDPFKLLSFKLSDVSDGRLPTAVGIEPVKDEVYPKSASTREVMSPTAEGIVPDSSVLEIIKYFAFIKLPMLEGIIPFNELCDKSIEVRVDSLPMEDGIVPSMSRRDR